MTEHTDPRPQPCDDEPRLSDEPTFGDITQWLQVRIPACIDYYYTFETARKEDKDCVRVCRQAAEYITQLRTSLAAANKRAEEAEAGMKSNFDRWTEEHYECRELRAQLASAETDVESVRLLLNELRTQLAEALHELASIQNMVSECDFMDTAECLAEIEMRCKSALARLAQDNNKENTDE